MALVVSAVALAACDPCLDACSVRGEYYTECGWYLEDNDESLRCYDVGLDGAIAWDEPRDCKSASDAVLTCRRFTDNFLERNEEHDGTLTAEERQEQEKFCREGKESVRTMIDRGACAEAHGSWWVTL